MMVFMGVSLILKINYLDKDFAYLFIPIVKAKNWTPSQPIL